MSESRCQRQTAFRSFGLFENHLSEVMFDRFKFVTGSCISNSNRESCYGNPMEVNMEFADKSVSLCISLIVIIQMRSYEPYNV